MAEPQSSAPSLVTQLVLVERYGLRLNVEQMADVLGMTPGAILNSISAGKFQIPTYLDGKRRFADFRDVAAYLDHLRAEAHRAGLPA